jgi:hypothetical protein
MSGLPNNCSGVNHLKTCWVKLFWHKLTTKLLSFYRRLMQRAKMTIRMTAVITMKKRKKLQIQSSKTLMWLENLLANLILLKKWNRLRWPSRDFKSTRLTYSTPTSSTTKTMTNSTSLRTLTGKNTRTVSSTNSVPSPQTRSIHSPSMLYRWQRGATATWTWTRNPSGLPYVCTWCLSTVSKTTHTRPIR